MGAQAITVRDTTVEDAGVMSRLRINTWRAAYAGLVPQEMLDRMDADRETRRRKESWEQMHAHPLVHDLFAEIDGEVVGWACLGPAREEFAVSSAELYAMYALHEHWSGGVGQALMEEAESRMRADGHESAYLWVLEGNERAIRFYERRGWLPDGGRKFEDGLSELRHVRDFAS